MFDQFPSSVIISLMTVMYPQRKGPNVSWLVLCPSSQGSRLDVPQNSRLVLLT